MKHAIAVVLVLILTAAISCKKTDKTKVAPGNANVGNTRNAGKQSTTGPASRPTSQRLKPADPNEAAKHAFGDARNLYKSGRDYQAAERRFLIVRQKFDSTQYAYPSQVYVHMCRVRRAIAAIDWPLAQKELDNASNLRRKIYKRSLKNSPVYKWATNMKLDIDQVQVMLTERRVFAEAISNAAKLYEEGKYDQAGEILASAHNNSGKLLVELPEDLQKKLLDFKEKLAGKGWKPKSNTSVIEEALRKRAENDALRKRALDLFEQEKWPAALPLLKDLKARNRGDRTIRDMLRQCEYQLVLDEFSKAVGANDYKKAMAVGEKARRIDPDAYERDIETKDPIVCFREKVETMLARGAAALKAGQYSETRKILDHLKDSYPEAADMIRRSRYLESIAKGDTAKKENNLKTALAMYKIAKRYAKTPAEHKEIDALIKTVNGS